MKQLLKRRLPTALLLLLCATAATAQGTFGHFGFGLALSANQRLQQDLQQPHLLGNDFAISGTGGMAGGGGMYLTESGLLLGGNGFALFAGSGTGSKGETELSSAAGFFNIGYALTSQNQLLFYPYAGFGGSGTTLEITNKSNAPFVLDAQHSLAPGQTGKYSADGIALEGGFGLKKLLGNANSRNGFILGLEFGTYGMPGLRAWEFDGSDRTITGLSATRSQAYYLRITFGGGRF